MAMASVRLRLRLHRLDLACDSDYIHAVNDSMANVFYNSAGNVVTK